MKNVAFLIYFISFVSIGQDMKIGYLLDSVGNQAIPYAHIQNITQQKFTVTNDVGYFQLPMRLGDSIWISCVGYQSLGVIIGEEWDALNEISIFPKQDTILLEALTVGRMPSEKVFKQRILDHRPDDQQEFYGIPNVDIGTSILLEDKYVKSVGYAIFHPFGFVYNNLSKKQKEKRKMHKINQGQLRRYEINQKYNRNYVAELTQLKDDRLTDFIAFCDFSEEFLYSSNQYQIAEAVMDKFFEFEQEGKG
jgi:hypothetical protein